MDVRYTNNDYQFMLRVSCLIFNKDESKVLLFNVEGRDFFLLPGGKVGELEESIDAIKREIKEELGLDCLDYKFLSVSEEFVHDKGYDNHQINLIYKGIYKGDITSNSFKGLEGDWINFIWVDVKDIKDYKIYPSIVYDFVLDSNSVYHSINNLLNK